MLINDIDTLIRFNSAANEKLNFYELQPCIEMAERWLVLNYIGQPQFTAIDTAQASQPLTLPQQALLPMLQRIIAAKALLFFIPKSEAMITSTGVVRTETENLKTAYQNQVIKLSRQLQYEVEIGVEELLAFLNTNSADYPLWVDTEPYRSNRKLFVQNGRQLAECYHVAAPYAVYQAIRPMLADVELQQLRPLLGEAFFGELKAKLLISVQVWSQPEIELLQYIRKYLVYSALHRSLASQLITWDQRGLTVYAGEGRSENSDDAKRKSIDPNQIDFLHRQLRFDADQWAQSLSYFLSATASTLVFTSWYNWQLAQQVANTPTSTHTHTSFSL